MAATGAILPKNMPMQSPNTKKRKEYCPMQHQSVINENKQKKEIFFISNIVSIVSSPSKKAGQNEVNAIKDLLQCSMSSAYHKKRLLKDVDI